MSPSTPFPTSPPSAKFDDVELAIPTTTTNMKPMDKPFTKSDARRALLKIMHMILLTTMYAFTAVAMISDHGEALARFTEWQRYGIIFAVNVVWMGMMVVTVFV